MESGAKRCRGYPLCHMSNSWKHPCPHIILWLTLINTFSWIEWFYLLEMPRYEMSVFNLQYQHNYTQEMSI